MALLESASIAMGAPASDFDLPGIDGKRYRLSDFADKPVLAVIFMCNHCPYVQAAWKRMVAIQKDYADRGVQLVGINANESDHYPEDSFENMPEYAKEQGQNFPYLRDESQAVARAYGAECTPDIFVYDRNRQLAYHGRIDDNWKEPSKVTSQDLRKALDLLVSGKHVDFEQKPSMGCSIKWK